MNQLQLYISPEHDCPYLTDRIARTLVVDPHAAMDSHVYGSLIDQGFRRNGAMVYRPGCTSCRLCIPVRIPADLFRPRRIHRRVARRWQEMTVSVGEARYEAEHFALFSRYLDTRHADGEMAGMSPTQYSEFLTCDWSKTRFVEFRRGGTLLLIAVMDLLPQGLSSVYTFFDPLAADISPGVYAILWQIAEARRQNLAWVYLGFMVPGCRKMEYKRDYRPMQAYDYSLDAWVEVDFAYLNKKASVPT